MNRPSNRPRPWWVYETSDRWIRAVRRFAPDIDLGWVFVNHPITPDLSQSIRQASLDRAAKRVILWQIDRSNLSLVASAVAQLGARHRTDLQIAAVSQLSPTILMSLSELGIATLIRHPEQLPGLKTMIRRHFDGES